MTLFANGQLAMISSRLRRRLYPYQREGVYFLFHRQSEEPTFAGGILGDDPGLGKTLQVIAVMEALVLAAAARRQAYRVLVIVAASLLRTWQSELLRWAPELPFVVLFESSNRQLHAQHVLTQLAAEKAQHIVVCSYEMNHLFGSGLRAGGGVDLLIVDEAHRLRNLQAMSLSVVSTPALCRLLMTGTPLPNRLLEFYALADMAVPGIFGERCHFEVDFVRVIERGTLAGATDHAREEAITASQLLSEVCTCIGRVIARIVFDNIDGVIYSQWITSKHQMICTRIYIYMCIHKYINSYILFS